MKNECRKKLVLLVVMVLTLMSIFTACDTESKINNYYDLDVVKHTSDFYVNDFAGLFTEEQKNELMAKAVSFAEEYSGIQVVITTVNSLDETVLGYEYVSGDVDGNSVQNTETKQPSVAPKFTIEQVAYSMYSQYGIGQDDMGILILFSTGDREVRIETGKQMQFYITDSISGRLLDNYGMEFFSNNQFAEGLVSVQDAVIDEIKSRVSADWYTTSQETQAGSEKAEDASSSVTTDNSADATSENVSATEKDSGKGILWGFFGSIVTAFAAIVAFIRQKLKSKSEKENLEKSKQEEINSMKNDFQEALNERDRIHNEKLSDVRSEYQRTIQEKNSDIREKNSRIRQLESDMRDAEGEIKTLRAQLEAITDKYNRVQQLHPEYNLDDEVYEMIEAEYRQAAQDVDNRLAEILDTPVNKDNYDVFKEALRIYDTTSPEVKKYVTSNRSAIQNLYDEAIRLKEDFERAEQEKQDKAVAKTAYDEIKSAYEQNSQGNYKTYEALHVALAIFLGLSAAQRNFFPDKGLIEKLNRLHQSAEEDHNDYEAAKTAESKVESIIGKMYSADEEDRDWLERAMGYYRDLTSAQQEYFSDELLRKLKRLINEADDDHRYQERRREEKKREEERRERARRASRTSSFHSSSSRTSYSGRGGRPSGGGASRRF